MRSNAQAARKTAATDGSTDVDRPHYTYHLEPECQGGERYVRCTGCGRENLVALGGSRTLAHADGCPVAAEEGR